MFLCLVSVKTAGWESLKEVWCIYVEFVRMDLSWILCTWCFSMPCSCAYKNNQNGSMVHVCPRTRAELLLGFSICTSWIDTFLHALWTFFIQGYLMILNLDTWQSSIGLPSCVCVLVTSLYLMCIWYTLLLLYCQLEWTI